MYANTNACQFHLESFCWSAQSQTRIATTAINVVSTCWFHLISFRIILLVCQCVVALTHIRLCTCTCTCTTSIYLRHP